MLYVQNVDLCLQMIMMMMAYGYAVMLAIDGLIYPVQLLKTREDCLSSISVKIVRNNFCGLWFLLWFNV